MSTRKRQRPSARDFFDFPPEQPTQEQPPKQSALILDFLKPQIKQEDLQQYLSDLITLDPLEQALELIRGRNKIDSLDSISEQPFIFVLKSNKSYNEFPHPIHQTLKISHIARLLWGPGKKEVAHGKTIYLGPLHFSVDESRALTTEEVYAIRFSDQRSADVAAQVIEYRLNQFFLSQKENLLVQVKTGSSRWFIKDKNKTLDSHGWQIEKKKIPYLRPLPTLKSLSTHSPHNPQNFSKAPDSSAKSSSFEISQLPKLVTIPVLLKNLLKLQWLEFPKQIKATEESTTDCPVRILMQFANSISAKICKLSLFHHGLNLQPDEQNNDDGKIVQFIIDEGDSSIDDSWNIWKNALVWDQQTIQDFIKSHESSKLNPQQEDEKVDQLEEDKPDGFGSDEFDEWASNNPTRERANGTRRPIRVRETASFQKRLEDDEKEWEKELERLTILADEEYLNNNQNSTKIQVSNRNSGFYKVSQRVLEDKQFNNLMDLIKTRSRRRKLTIECRKVKPLSKKVKRQRRVWRSGQVGPNERDQVTTEEEEEEEELQSDEPDHHQRAAFTEQDWRQFRHKTRAKRLLDPTSSEDENDDELVSKSLITNDQVYQHKLARRNEPLPGDVN